MIVNIRTQDPDVVDPDEIAAVLHRELNLYVAEVNVNNGLRVWEDGGYVTDNRAPGDAAEDEALAATFPQAPEEARTCIHGNRVWFGHECGLCDAEGRYRWAD